MKDEARRAGSCRLGSLLGALFLAACFGDSTEPLPPETAEVGVVLSSTDLSLTIFEVENPAQTRIVGLGPAGTPVTMAVRGNFAAVPLGIVSAVAVVDLKEGVRVRTVGLPTGSGATGAAFLNDSIVLVANSDLNSVTPVNVLAGTLGSTITVGRYPQAVVVEGGRAFVVNAELVDFAPAGPATVSVIDIESLTVTSTIQLSGENAGPGGVGPDGRLYIVNTGSFDGSANGSLSVVNLTSLPEEVEHHTGFGDGPGSLALGPAGRAFVGAFSYGVAVWDTSLDAFIRGPAEALRPGGSGVTGLAFDEAGRLYTLTADCVNPTTANRLDGTFAIDVTIPVGTCPIAIAFTTIEEEN